MVYSNIHDEPMQIELTKRELRLCKYLVDYAGMMCQSEPDLVIEAAQEAAPESQDTDEPLTDIYFNTLKSLYAKLKDTVDQSSS